jgi:hypothetical protein
MASESLTIFENLLLMALCMTFGGAPCLSMWEFISETLADISNTIIHNEHWDHLSLHDNISLSLKDPLSVPEDIGFLPAQPLAVHIPTNNIIKVNIYNDDSIGIALDLNDKHRRVSYSIPLAIHA